MEARDFIKALIDRGMTQSDIADRTGIPQPSISKVARGEVDDVLSRSYRKLQALHEEVCGEGDKRPFRSGASLTGGSSIAAPESGDKATVAAEPAA